MWMDTARHRETWWWSDFNNNICEKCNFGKQQKKENTNKI